MPSEADAPINTYDQLVLAETHGIPPVAASLAASNGRASYYNGAHAWHLRKPTEPNGPWYDYGQKRFFSSGGKTAREDNAAAIELAKAWLSEHYGVTEWARNGMGDWVPAEVQKRWPLRRERINR